MCATIKMIILLNEDEMSEQRFDFSRVSLVDLLERHGVSPAYVRGDSAWFHSPFREDNTPSLQVRGNVFTDWGDLNFKGGVLVFCKKLWDIPDGEEREVFKKLESIYGGSFMPAITTTKPRKKEKGIQTQKEERIIANYPLNNDALLRYLESRGVDREVAQTTCRVLVFLNKDRSKKLYGIGFPNQLGGYELRNEFMKISFAPKAISVIGSGENKNAVVFEGFIDALSYLSLKKRRGESLNFDIVVLNGINQVNQAIDHLKGYERVFGLVDTDRAGDSCTESLSESLPNFVDSRVWLGEYNDVNEKIMAMLNLPPLVKREKGVRKQKGISM